MQTIVTFFTTLAMLGIVVAGFASIFGVKALREKMFGFVALAVGIALAVPLIFAVAGQCFGAIKSALGIARIEAPSGLPLLIVLGHFALAVILIRRRFRSADGVRRRRDDLERARTRERQRIAPRPEEPTE